MLIPTDKGRTDWGIQKKGFNGSIYFPKDETDEMEEASFDEDYKTNKAVIVMIPWRFCKA